MPRSPTVERAVRCLVLIAYNFVGYFATNRFNEDRSVYFDPSFAFEAHIPFVPLAIFAYLMVWVNLCVGVLSIPLADIAFFRRAWRWLMTNVTIAYAIFLALPVRADHRPDLSAAQTLPELIAGFYFSIDAPTNLLPSLHVELAVMAGLLCLRRARWLGVGALAVSAGIVVSVLLVKQHYIADIVLALALVFGTGRAMGVLPVQTYRQPDGAATGGVPLDLPMDGRP
jgi:hypothetical protein